MGVLDWTKMFKSSPDWTKDKITLDPRTNEYLSELSSILTKPAPPPVPTLTDRLTAVAASQMRTDMYTAQVKAYEAQFEAQFEAYTAKFFAKQQKTNPMPNNKVLFSVHIATNGYYAVSDNGITVVSTTLSDVCTAMQAALADEAARSDTSDLRQQIMKDPLNQKGWQQIT